MGSYWTYWWNVLDVHNNGHILAVTADRFYRIFQIKIKHQSITEKSCEYLPYVRMLTCMLYISDFMPFNAIFRHTHNNVFECCPASIVIEYHAYDSVPLWYYISWCHINHVLQLLCPCTNHWTGPPWILIHRNQTSSKKLQEPRTISGSVLQTRGICNIF